MMRVQEVVAFECLELESLCKLEGYWQLRGSYTALSRAPLKGTPQGQHARGLIPGAIASGLPLLLSSVNGTETLLFLFLRRLFY